MNVKLRAGLEVATGIVGVVVVALGVRTILEVVTKAYGIDAVLNGLAFGSVVVVTYVIVGLLYDMRVAKLQYRAKLEEMTKK